MLILLFGLSAGILISALVRKLDERNTTCLSKKVKVRVTDARPNIFGPCELKHGSVVTLDKVQLLCHETYYHVQNMNDDLWYRCNRFESIK